MTHLERFILTLGIIFVSISLGYLCKICVESGKLPGSQECWFKWRKKAQSLAIFILMPFSAMLSLWGLPRPESELIALPLPGLASYIIGGVLALLAARMLKLGRKATGAFYCCGTFSNIAAVGGLICLLLFGANSIALVAIYRLTEEIYYFSVTIPIAKWFSREKKDAPLAFGALRPNPALMVIVGALALGVILNLRHVNRPEYFGFIASSAMLVATVILLFGIGLTLRLSSLAGYARPAAAMCAIKFIAVPIAITSLAWLMGFGDYDNGLVLKVVAVLSAMPVAMTALVPPALFDLDVDLANACWIYSTLGLVFVLPALMLVSPAL